jgi:hypothetical protein
MSNGDNAYTLNNEVMMTLSKHYDAPFLEQTVIQPVALTPLQLEAYKGEYLLLTDIGYNGDFISKISVNDGKVTIQNPGEPVPSRLVPENTAKFISAVSGNEFVFKFEGKKITGLTVAGRFELQKIK